ncbi:Precorrin-8X methylmutase [Ammonifex degensii KC4]|uniref:Precorrin-8X methylmutase n=1 Tax=Ammonifex degensii (strain DSM 10501 / KC4) TaxID=429009 RepID=C9RCU8_AMMDK|nr:precorrin-8X methylmutase [Ammonifex degensii]ACX52075.1 Precorrin-8X methylmutase [Ammonifex degensii KC4]
MSFFLDPRIIEAESFRRIEAALAPYRHRFTEEELEVVKRVIHATGDVSLVEEIFFRPGAVAAGVEAVSRGTKLICDVEMVAAGVKNRYPGPIKVAVSLPGAAELADKEDVTRSLAGMRLLKEELAGSLVAVGNAPTALLGVLEAYREGIRPALVVGVPVGLVGAAEAKEALWSTDLPAVVLRGTRGGSPVAAAVVNALVSLARKGR